MRAPPDRLVTFVDLRDMDARRLSVSARLEAVLADGTRILLLDDRGWSVSESRSVSRSSREAETPSWSVEDIEETARFVVGPDEAFGDRSLQDMAADHWGRLAGICREHGVPVDGAALERLPHDVVLGERLLARLQP